MNVAQRRIKGSIPVELYLKKFALWMDNAQDTGVVELKGKGLVSIYIKMLLCFKNKLTTSPAINDRCNSKLEYFIDSRHFNRGDYFLPAAAITSFNTMLQELFHSILLQRIVTGHELGQKQQNIILDFLDELDIAIEVDIAYDTIKKAQYRLRKEREIYINFRQKSPVK